MVLSASPEQCCRPDCQPVELQGGALRGSVCVCVFSSLTGLGWRPSPYLILSLLLSLCEVGAFSGFPTAAEGLKETWLTLV